MDRFILNPDILLRKEWFGCLGCDTSNATYFQYNEDAFEILSELTSSYNTDELRKKLNKKNMDIDELYLKNFLSDMMENNIVNKAEDTDNEKSGLVFYKDHDISRKDCLVAPFSVTIYLTEKCPKRCKHCIVSSSPEASECGDLQVKEWETVLKKLRDFGVFTLVLTGGEIFVKKGIFDILKIASDLRFNITLLSDFDGLNQTHMDFIKTLPGVNTFQMSLDGGTKESHDFIRGKGAFDLAMRRMKLLNKNGIKYTISTAVNNININELDKICDIYKEHGAAYLYLNPLSPYGRAKEQVLDLLLTEAELKKLSEKYFEIVHKKGINPGNPYWESLTAEEVYTPEFNPFANAPHAFSLGIYVLSIDSKGNCTIDSKTKSLHLLQIGNALEDDIEKIWYSPALDSLRSCYSPEKFTIINNSEFMKLISA